MKTSNTFVALVVAVSACARQTDDAPVVEVRPAPIETGDSLPGTPPLRELEPGQEPPPPTLDRYGQMFVPPVEEPPALGPQAERAPYTPFAARARQPKRLRRSGWQVGVVGEVRAYRDGKTHLAWSEAQKGSASYVEKVRKEVRDHPIIKMIGDDPTMMDLAEAQRVCQRLGANGWWRLPTRDEFVGAIERGLHGIHSAEGGLWTSTLVTGDILYEGHVWTVNLSLMDMAGGRYVHKRWDPRMPASTVCVLPPLEAPIK